MAADILDQLAETNVPPLPDQFDRQVHQRLNHTLLWLHLVDLVVRGFPFAVIHFARAVAGLFMYTLVGRFEQPSRDDAESP